jgi:hypothetical protein
MSIQTLQKLVAMFEREEQNLRFVEDRLRSAGMDNVPTAVIASIARYYDALQKLSAE